MKDHKRGAAVLLIVWIVCALLSGCSPKRDVPAWNAVDAEPEYLTQWPENAFTEKITKPQSGTVDYVLDGSDSGRYAIFIKGISAEACGRYIESLKDMGYAEIHAAGNTVSVGTMLEREDAYVSVSYAEGLLGVQIIQKG